VIVSVRASRGSAARGGDAATVAGRRRVGAHRRDPARRA
jgi:hypothetical protein